MPIAKESGGSFVPLPPGSHIARCIGVVSLGTQPSNIYAATYKVMLTWEVPGEQIKVADGKTMPSIINKEYTLSLGKKSNLRKDLEGWRGREFTPEELKGFEVERILDQVCMLSVIHKQSQTGNVRATITGISRLPKGVVCPARAHELVHYEIEWGKDERFNKLPEWIRKKIEVCEEWLHPQIDQETLPEGEQAPAVVEEDDVPF